MVKTELPDEWELGEPYCYCYTAPPQPSYRSKQTTSVQPDITELRRNQSIAEGKPQRRVYVEKGDMRSKKLARKVGGALVLAELDGCAGMHVAQEMVCMRPKKLACKLGSVLVAGAGMLSSVVQ
eukprot:1157286-Pelagomonas_calceolata.AAC.9